MIGGSRRAGDLRQSLLWMMIWVAIVHAVFVAVYFAADIEAAAPRLRMIFTATWTAGTFVVVTLFLRRIRRIRREHRR